MRFANYILIVFSILFSGCLSEEEIQARQDNAFDISGNYQTSEDSEVQLNFNIVNQNVKHDIFITVTRSNPHLEKENEFFSKLAQESGVSLETLKAEPLPSTFGGDVGLFDEVISGGDNVSRDFGETSDFMVCSDNPKKIDSTKVIENAQNVQLVISYCLTGLVKKENKNLIEEGTLSVGASYFYDVLEEDGETGVDVDPSGVEDVVLNYKATKQ
ncbi:MAG: hypothetical protein OXK80_00300 [Bdellovibrionales bacterium]|nr:hypothetical protein [Bdellovibrionales bacterium]